jgi:hypothetical protein
MPITTINNLGTLGVVKDLPPFGLAPNAFTDANNVRFDNNSVQTITGETIYSTSVAIAPDYGIHWRRPDQGYNIFAKNGNIVRVDSAGNTSSMFTSADAAYNNSKWDGCTFNGGYAIVLNNGVTTPKYCLYGSTTAGSSFQDLPGWNYLSGLTVNAKIIRQLGYALVACNLTLTQDSIITNAPNTIRISAQAAPGNIPAVWQPGTTADTADEFELSSTSPILEAGELRGNLYVYSSDAINVVTLGQSATRVQPYAKGYGILNTRCLSEFDGQHFVVDRNDIYVHGGSGGIKSVANFKVRDFFFNQINQAAIDKVYVERNARNDEIWVHYPTGSSTTCNKVAIYQYRLDNWSFRDAPNTTSSFVGPSPENNSFFYGKETIYSTTGTTRVFLMDRGYQMWNGTALANYTSYVAKEKLSIGDLSSTNTLGSLYPVFDNVPSDSTITITVTGNNNYIAPADWSNADGRDSFVIEPNDLGSTGYKVDPRVNGRLLNFKISSTGYWRLSLIGVDVKSSDRR